MKKYLSETASLFWIAATIVLLDQVTKSIIRANLSLGEIYRPDLWITQYARIIHWQNYGAAFGIFQSLGSVFMVLSFVVSIVIIYYYHQVPRQDWLVRLAMGLLLGGAVGNLIDRLHQGFVTDFISVGQFPVFNIADASISTGVAILFIGMWMQERRKDIHEQKPDGGTLAAPPPSEDVPGE